MTTLEKTKTVLAFTKEPVIDKLTYIVPWGIGPMYQQEEGKRSFEKVEQRVTTMKEAGECEMWRAKGRYLLHARISVPGGAKVTIGLGARKPIEQKGGIRVEFNPAKFEPGDAEYMHAFIRRAVGRSYDTHLVNAIVNRLDIAVDAVHVVLSDLLVDYRGAHEATVFGTRLKKGGRVETLNFGSVSSSFRTTVYSKSKERVDKAIKTLLKGGQGTDKLKHNLVRQVHVARAQPPTVRVEVRGMKVAKPVYELKGAGKNRFERFLISELTGLDALDPFARRCFMALVRTIGLRAAIEHYEGRPEHKLMKAVVTRSATWWKPEGLWVRGLKVLKASGIFPGEAFQRPTKR